MRAVLSLLAVGAALPALAEAQQISPTETSAVIRFAPPDDPVVVTRTVWRNLRDGKQIVVHRSYLIEFSANGDGYLVSGRQIASDVEAPPALEPLARLERSRADSHAFPLYLDITGRIRLGPAPAGDATRLSGHDAARALIAGAHLSPADEREARTALASLTTQESAVPWPLDLFNPRQSSQTDRRTVALADGSIGTLTVTVQAETRRADGLPHKVTRDVISDLGSSRSVSREEWTFTTPIGP